MLPTDVLIEWLDLKLPSWLALLAAVFLGLLGILALSFLIALFSPGSLAFWMPMIALFCGASAGYTFWQKRRPQPRLALVLLCLAAGLATGLSAAALQLVVDARLFQTNTSPMLLSIYLGSGLAGSGLGGLLRSRFERLEAAGSRQ